MILLAQGNKNNNNEIEIEFIMYCFLRLCCCFLKTQLRVGKTFKLNDFQHLYFQGEVVVNGIALTKNMRHLLYSNNDSTMNLHNNNLNKFIVRSYVTSTCAVKSVSGCNINGHTLCISLEMATFKRQKIS